MSDEPVVAESTPELAASRLFRYSTYVHVGEDAETCVDRENGRCQNQGHFHAFVRIPNALQMEELQKRARAARARHRRALEDPESDASAILEADLAEVRAGSSRELIIEQLLGATDLMDRLSAMRELEGEEGSRWEHRTEDVMRLRELEALDPADRPEGEYEQLVREGEEYIATVERKIEETRAPRRSALESLSLDELLAKWREERIGVETGAAAQSAFTRYQYAMCVLKPCLNGHPQERAFADVNAVEAAAPEVLEAIEKAYVDLGREQLQGKG